MEELSLLHRYPHHRPCMRMFKIHQEADAPPLVPCHAGTDAVQKHPVRQVRSTRVDIISGTRCDA